LVHATEKQLSENASNAAVAAVKDDIEKAIAATKEAIASDDSDKIKSATTALAQVAMKIGEAIYSAKGGAEAEAGEPGSGGDNAAGSDNVVDADFEEVKDDKKKSA
jgi:molecular chaperone DnaK